MIDNFTRFFIIVATVGTPMYSVRLTVGNIPINILDIFGILACISGIISAYQRRIFWRTVQEYRMILIGFGGLFLGAMVVLFVTHSLHVAGAIKSWLIIPFGVGMVTYWSLRESVVRVKTILYSVVCGTLIISLIAIGYDVLGITTYDLRLSGFFESPNQLAMSIAPGLIVSLVFLWKDIVHIYLVDYQNTALRRRIFLVALVRVGIVMIIGYVLWHTESSATLGAVVVTMFILAIINYWSKFWVFCVIVVFGITSNIFVVLMSAHPASDQYMTTHRSSLASRMMIWRASVHIGHDYWFAGVGPTQFQDTYLAYQQFYPPYLEWAVPHPHNVLLATWLYFGIFGIVGWLLVYWGVIIKLFNMWQSMNGYTSQRYIIMAIVGYFFLVLLGGMWDTTVWKNDLAIIFWIFVALGWYITHQFTQNRI